MLAATLAASLVLGACGGDDDSDSTEDTESVTDDSAEASGEASGEASTEGESETETDSGASDATLVVGQILEPNSLDPSIQANIASGQLVRQWAETLVYLDEDFNIQPMLAESIEQIDDVTYQVNLREGVLFQNGEEMTADDVVFSLARGAERPEASSTLGSIDVDGFEIIDDYTLTLTTLEPSAAFLGNLAHDQASIVSETVATERGEAFGQDVSGAGTGPFELVSWTPGVGVELVRFDDYWGDTAGVATIEWNFVPDESSRLVMLETGQIDVMFGVSALSAQTLDGNDDVEVTVIDQPRNRAFFFGQAEGMPTADVLVRQAISSAINRPALVQAVFGDFANTANGMLPPGVLGYDPDLVTYDYDPDRAVELLEEAGYGPGELEITLTFFHQEQLVRLAEIVQADLDAVGINAEILPMEATAWVDALAEGTVEFGFHGTSSRSGDPNDILYSRFHSENIPSPNNNQVNDPELDALLEEGLVTFDRDERDAVYREIDALIAENAYSLAFSNELVALGAQSDLEGLVFDRTNSPRFYTVTTND